MTFEAMTKPKYEDYFAPHVIWWPWWVGVECLRRATLCETTKENLMKRGRRGEFYFSKNAEGHKAPLSNAPVDNDTTSTNAAPKESTGPKVR